ncbi:MAG: methyltransferase [Proteobacteria bacterium]|nr:methyltransferase [Pseudomonadota bacterium]
MTPAETARFIADNTSLMRSHLVPEIELHLASDSHAIFSAAEALPRAPIDRYPPYWAFAWPGGQALARYLLDHHDLVRGRRIADIGAGSGIAAIAASMAGAAQVLAADVDGLAAAAVVLNAAGNRSSGVEVDTTTVDILADDPDWDVIVIGDLVYEPELATRVGAYLDRARRRGITVLVGDRLSSRRPASAYEELARYPAPLTPSLSDHDDHVGRIWATGVGA